MVDRIGNRGTGTCWDGVRAMKGTVTGRAPGNSGLLVAHDDRWGPGDVVIWNGDGRVPR